MRPITAQPISPKRDTFSPHRIDAESFHNNISTRDLEDKISSKLLEAKQFNGTTIKKNIASYESSSRPISHTDSIDLTKNDPATDPTNDLLSFYTDKEDDLSVEDYDDSTPTVDSDHLDEATSQIPSHAKLGIGVGIVPPPVVKSEPVTSVTNDSSAAIPAITGSAVATMTQPSAPAITEPVAPAITESSLPLMGPATLLSAPPDLPNIDALSSALSTLILPENPEISNNEEFLPEANSSLQDSKVSLSEQEKGSPVSSLLRMSTPGTDAKNSASVGAPATSAQSLPAPVAMAVRTARFSDFLTELTATVDRARLNTSQDMTLQLRSDVLEATNIHISGDATHINVVFSTVNAASNALLNSHLETLQNHLVALCPGQLVDIKMTPMASTGSSTFGDKDDSSSDLASFDQGNRGNSRNNDDVL